MLTVERVRHLLVYDHETGILKWRVYRPGTSAGTVAGCANGNGYVRVYVDNSPRYAHRLAWMLHYGEQPPSLIDHINGDRSDNRIINLRAGDKRLNAENQKRARRDSRVGLLGVSKSRDRWLAQIVVIGQHHYIGSFNTPEEAHAAYVNVKRRLHVGNTL